MCCLMARKHSHRDAKSLHAIADKVSHFMKYARKLADNAKTAEEQIIATEALREAIALWEELRAEQIWADFVTKKQQDEDP